MRITTHADTRTALRSRSHFVLVLIASSCSVRPVCLFPCASGWSYGGALLVATVVATVAAFSFPSVMELERKARGGRIFATPFYTLTASWCCCCCWPALLSACADVVPSFATRCCCSRCCSCCCSRCCSSCWRCRSCRSASRFLSPSCVWRSVGLGTCPPFGCGARRNSRRSRGLFLPHPRAFHPTRAMEHDDQPVQHSTDHGGCMGVERTQLSSCSAAGSTGGQRAVTLKAECKPGASGPRVGSTPTHLQRRAIAPRASGREGSGWARCEEAATGVDHA